MKETTIAIALTMVCLLLAGTGFCTGTASADTISYNYDDAGRLIAVEYPNDIAITYTYDAMGNLLAREIGSAGWSPLDYDGNSDGDISKTEALEAVVDYFGGEIDKSQALEVIVLYFS